MDILHILKSTVNVQQHIQIWEKHDPFHISFTAWRYTDRFPVLKWPTHSPDLSPVENIWCLKKQKIHQRRPRHVERLESYIRLTFANKDGLLCSRKYDCLFVLYKIKIDLFPTPKGHNLYILTFDMYTRFHCKLCMCYFQSVTFCFCLCSKLLRVEFITRYSSILVIILLLYYYIYIFSYSLCFIH